MGKTGTGKTTMSALVALAGAGRGRRVLVVDTDINPNLALSLGLGLAAVDPDRVVPRVLVTGRAGGGVTGEQLVRGYGVPTPSGVVLLQALRASEEPAGCGCAAHASARSVLADALDQQADLAVLDLEDGLDHLERPSGTLAHVDHLLVVAEPSRKSLLAAERMIGQARAAGVQPVSMVGNKAHLGEGEAEVLAEAAASCGVALAGVVPDTAEIFDADRAGLGLTLSPVLQEAVGAVLDAIA